MNTNHPRWGKAPDNSNCAILYSSPHTVLQLNPVDGEPAQKGNSLYMVVLVVQPDIDWKVYEAVVQSDNWDQDAQWMIAAVRRLGNKLPEEQAQAYLRDANQYWHLKKLLTKLPYRE